MINTVNTTQMPMCAMRRRLSSLGRSFISTQKLVVRAVSAESALLKQAATIPMVNKMVTVVPNFPVAANIGSRSSVLAGNSHPCCWVSMMSNTPKLRNSRLAGTKKKP